MFRAIGQSIFKISFYFVKERIANGCINAYAMYPTNDWLAHIFTKALPFAKF